MQQKHAYQNFKDEELWYSQKGNQTIKNTTKVYATNIWQVVTWFSPSNMTKTYFAIKLWSFSAFNGDIANLPIWCFQRPKIYGRYLQLFSVPVAWPLPYIGLYKAYIRQDYHQGFWKSMGICRKPHGFPWDLMLIRIRHGSPIQRFMIRKSIGSIQFLD